MSGSRRRDLIQLMLILAMALLAGALPTLRAARADPLDPLRIIA